MLSTSDLRLVQSLLFDRIGGARSVEAASLIWIMSRRMLEEYPEATIVEAVRRFVGRRSDQLGAGCSAEIGSNSQGTDLAGVIEFDASFRKYVETCVVAEHGIGAIRPADLERALQAALESYARRGQTDR